MPFERFKEKHGGRGPFETAYEALFPYGVLGRRGLDDERDLTNELVSRVQADDELAGLDGLVAAAQQPLTREQHHRVRAALTQAVVDQRTINAGYAGFQAQQAELRERMVNANDEEQLGVMDSQMTYAHRLLTSSNPQLQAAGTALATKVLDAQQAYATQNEAQRLAKDAADETARTALGNERWSRFQQIGDDLRSESAPYLVQARSWNAVNAAIANPTAAGDLALVYGVMHVIEPGSAVQQGELANAANAAGVPDIVLTAYNRILRDGQRLTPDERQQFYQLARDTMQSANTGQLERNSRALATGRAGGIGDEYLRNLQQPVAPLGDMPKAFGPPQQVGGGASDAEPPEWLVDPRFAEDPEMPLLERVERIFNEDLQRRPGETLQQYRSRVRNRRAPWSAEGVINRPVNE